MNTDIYIYIHIYRGKKGGRGGLLSRERKQKDEVRQEFKNTTKKREEEASDESVAR
jgi:hypothetical protein